jgi:HPt (histidine-containing phosphotransfer) domain-containing protein/CheY-like chemotaxis protein
LRLVEARVYDGFLIDLNLPDRSGYQILADIRRVEERLGRKPAPAAALTASLDGEVTARCRSAGFRHCLAKPLAKKTFLALLQPEGGASPGVSGPALTDDSLDDLIPGYLRNRREDLARMSEALARQDWTVIEELAHKAKGSGASFGFPELTEICRDLEKAARAGRADAAAQGVRRFEDFLARVEGTGRSPVPGSKKQ